MRGTSNYLDTIAFFLSENCPVLWQYGRFAMAGCKKTVVPKNGKKNHRQQIPWQLFPSKLYCDIEVLNAEATKTKGKRTEVTYRLSP